MICFWGGWVWVWRVGTCCVSSECDDPVKDVMGFEIMHYFYLKMLTEWHMRYVEKFSKKQVISFPVYNYLRESIHTKCFFLKSDFISGLLTYI